MKPTTLLAAAVQMEARAGELDANLRMAGELVDDAARRGARLIVLPEFFTSAIGFLPALADAALPIDGAATALLVDRARRYDAVVGGSFLCRDDDGHVRNAFVLATPNGVAGRHDKDLPTMWENCFYVGGHDDGLLDVGDSTLGVALCWEFMRSQTARRLRGAVDVVVGGSGWWSVPAWAPRQRFERLEAGNERLALGVVPAMARLVGAPVVHAAHAGTLACPMPWSPMSYRGHFEGGAQVCASDGRVLARRTWREGAGVAMAEIALARSTPLDPVPGTYWLHRRGWLATAMWHSQRAHGRRFYRQTHAYPPRATSQTRSAAIARLCGSDAVSPDSHVAR